MVEDLFAAFLGLKGIVSHYGITVDHAKDGPEGVEKAITHHYPFILMDIGLPVFDGIEATKRIRRAGVKSPIFAVTANLREFTKKNLFEVGMQGAYEKPFTEYPLAEIFQQNRLFVPENETLFMSRVPVLEPANIVYERTLLDAGTLASHQHEYIDHLKVEEATLQEAFSEHDLTKLIRAASSLEESSFYLGTLQIRLAATWLKEIITLYPSDTEKMNHYYHLLCHSIANALETMNQY